MARNGFWVLDFDRAAVWHPFQGPSCEGVRVGQTFEVAGILYTILNSVCRLNHDNPCILY